MAATPEDALVAGTKQYLSELPDDQFAALVDEVRQPPADDRTNDTVRTSGTKFTFGSTAAKDAAAGKKLRPGQQEGLNEARKRFGK